MPQSTDDILTLLSATNEELLSALGAVALTVNTSPGDVLRAGRRGEFYATPPPMLGVDGVFDHEQLREAGRAFIRRWAKEIRKAVCENPTLYATEKQEANKQVDVWIATLVASLTASIPALGAFTVVLNLLAVIIVHSGLTAFCARISPDQAGS